MPWTNHMTGTLHVAVAVIQDKKKRVLITKRASHTLQGGLWEFPGGKLELGETAVEALIREIKEELDLTVQHAEYLTQFTHVYPARKVTLWVYEVTKFTGIPRCCEAQQDLQWVRIQDLKKYTLLEASQKIISLISGKITSE
jgi:8-oxo-dGTP diphosphatase